RWDHRIRDPVRRAIGCARPGASLLAVAPDPRWLRFARRAPPAAAQTALPAARADLLGGPSTRRAPSRGSPVPAPMSLQLSHSSAVSPPGAPLRFDSPVLFASTPPFLVPAAAAAPRRARTAEARASAL